jgi:hypothetical protein
MNHETDKMHSSETVVGVDQTWSILDGPARITTPQLVPR